jgi:hypothetical protein
MTLIFIDGEKEVDRIGEYMRVEEEAREAREREREEKDSEVEKELRESREKLELELEETKEEIQSSEKRKKELRQGNFPFPPFSSHTFPLLLVCLHLHQRFKHFVSYYT